MFAITTISTIPDLEEFLEKYGEPEQPVLIKGLANTWPAREKWGPDQLRAALHDHPDVADRGVFFVSRKPVLEDDIVIPDFLKSILQSDQVMSDSIAWRFWVNRRHNRTEFHYDTNAENVITVQVKGRKEWVLVSPDTPLPCYPFTNFTLLKDEEKLLRNKRYCKFDLEEGDLLYVPPYWYHRAVAKEDVNININWTYTKCATSVLTREFQRDIERISLLNALKNHRWPVVRKGFAKVIGALPKVGGIGWGLKSFISSPYTPGRFAILRRTFKELLNVPGMLMTLPAVRTTLKKVDKT
ncbi:Cupin-like domain-containing protein [Roseibium hamelinense]|uniref:Cupin-like domain-containing protein n=1 Tax=Roseibium hamelinense TaxID=150831 RepID=A0A562T7A2_9HYPH|nr:cupin-like domain-containing protein [Roseibium hamelinense]MTI42796.1 hypothetical protein [Roseibium hamelinense]TWI89461.1 Cupin-like domain-containing protein [Roseibium hamelinense]